MASLEIPWEDHIRSLVQHAALMYVAKGPVVVALIHKVVERTRGVVDVASHSSETRMQDADVEHARDRVRVVGDQVVGNVALPEALTVERGADLLELECFRLSCRKRSHVLWENEAAGDLALCIVVSVEQEGRNTGLCEPPHVSHEEKARLVVPPVTVVKVSRNDYEGDLLLNRLSDEIVECPTCCRPNAFGSAPFLAGESLERTVEMNIGRVNETE